MPHETPLLFPSEGHLLSGVLVAPDSRPARGPVVITTGSWLTVKEQMPLLYARRLAARGIAAFAFDFSSFGTSTGSPRQLEVPLRKATEIAAAARYLSSLSIVDEGRVGLLAICASAQYGLRALREGAPIASYASVAGWFHDSATVAPFYGGDEGVQMRLRAAGDAWAQFRHSGEAAMVPAYREGDMSAGMFFRLDYYADPARGAVPEWRNEMAAMSWTGWLMWDGLSSAKHVTTPSLMVHSDDCALPDNARAVFNDLAGPKRLHWSTGFQTDFYDLPKPVDEAVDLAVTHFRETLS